jgi:hypothetical protein
LVSNAIIPPVSVCLIVSYPMPIARVLLAAAKRAMLVPDVLSDDVTDNL